MRRSDSNLSHVVLLGVVLLVGCDELNPNYDPDGGPVCERGERQCDSTGSTVQLCREPEDGFTDERDCWAGSSCLVGGCQPEDPADRCYQHADCVAPELCTVLVDPDQPDHLGTFCIPAPLPAGRPGGQACSIHEDCQSGWCFRQVCFEACSDAGQCTNTQHECATLTVTVDGVQEAAAIHGCVPPG
ncbi:MAG: hypothetical protein ABI333_29405 [bacterium]